MGGLIRVLFASGFLCIYFVFPGTRSSLTAVEAISSDDFFTSDARLDLGADPSSIHSSKSTKSQAERPVCRSSAA